MGRDSWVHRDLRSIPLRTAHQNAASHEQGCCPSGGGQRCLTERATSHGSWLTPSPRKTVAAVTIAARWYRRAPRWSRSSSRAVSDTRLGPRGRAEARGIGSAKIAPMPSKPYPSEPCPTYHLHDDDTWEWGTACDGCAPVFLVSLTPEQERMKSVRWNTKQLGDKHRTVRSEVQEHYDRARRDGRDITRV